MLNNFNNFEFNFDINKSPIIIYPKRQSDQWVNGRRIKLDVKPIHTFGILANNQNQNITFTDGSGGVSNVGEYILEAFEKIPYDSIIKDQNGNEYKVTNSTVVSGTDFYYYQLKNDDNE